MGDPAKKLDSHPSSTLGWITTASLAIVLGKPNARAGRDWCKRHGVPIERDGKTNWARVADVKRALAKFGSANATPLPEDRAAAIEASFAAFKTGGSRGT